MVKPVVSVITSLSLDHTKVLGDTLAKIAFEKAGIIKPGRPVVMAPQREEARLVVERVAFERETKLVQVGRDILFPPHQHSLGGQSLLPGEKEQEDGPLYRDRISQRLGATICLSRCWGIINWKNAPRLRDASGAPGRRFPDH